MRSIFLLTIFLLTAFCVASAQENARFKVEISNDSILLGNYFEVRFNLENAEGKNFEAPPLDEFQVISGPNYSSSYSMINGQVSQAVTYSYHLAPKDIGNFYLQPATIQVGDKVLETEVLEILAAPNPDGFIQRPPNNRLNFQFDWGPSILSPPQLDSTKLKKKKRKTYKL